MSRLASCVLCWLFALSVSASFAADDFNLVKAAEGIYVAQRSEPPGFTFVANMVFIVNDDDAVVVDTGVGPATAKAAIAALKKLTSKPVRYIVNTHWHDDHMMGNSTWREAYPGVEFIGHARAEAEMMSTGVSNRKQLLEQGPAFAKQIRDALAKNENLAGKPISNEERLAYLSDVAWAERYFTEAPRFSLIAPTLTVEDHMTLVRGKRTIEIRHLGRAHTGADLIVHLPLEKIVITGDLVVWPIPLYGSTSFPVDYIATLDKLLALNASTLIPGHGPVMKDDRYARSMLALLKSIESQVRAAVARGETLEQVRKSVKLDVFRKEFAGDSAMLNSLFSSYAQGPGVARAYQQIRDGL
ncbi:MAG: MBL fold metallo-hydrolase [Betaproteobacteria bacterium]|nr:MBL fold metallo-hydrolase [Betaproteobacteria bacterium]